MTEEDLKTLREIKKDLEFEGLYLTQEDIKLIEYCIENNLSSEERINIILAPYKK